MKSALLSSRRPLSHRLETLTLGIGAAAAAGAVLPQRAEAVPPQVTGFQVNNTTVSVSGTDWVHLWINPNQTGTANPVHVGSGFSYGWHLNFNYGEFGVISGEGYYSYHQFLPNLYTATGTANIATYTGWDYQFSASPVSIGQSSYLGLRSTDDNIYGWVNIQTGSITHLQSAFNFDPAGPISIGQTGTVIPEPSRAVLLASGLAGIALARRRRKAHAA